MLHVTELAADALRTSRLAARRFDSGAGLRISRDGSGVRVDLAREPLVGDDTLDVAGFVVWVQAGLNGVIDVGDHNRFVLRSAGHEGTAST